MIDDEFDDEEGDEPDWAGLLAAGTCATPKRRDDPTERVKCRSAKAKPKAKIRAQPSLVFPEPPPPPPDPVVVAGGAQYWRRAPCFYVFVTDATSNAGHNRRFGLLLGPFPTLDGANAWLDRGKLLAERCDQLACFYGFGTCKVADGAAIGRLNDLAGIIIEGESP